MKTRTLLLLSVGTALAILLAGGVLLFQLSGQESVSVSTPLGEIARVGDAEVVVVGTELADGALVVTVEVGGVDDADGADGFRLVTGDRQLEPIASPDHCAAFTEVVRRCAVGFDVGGAEGSSRVLILRRGDAQATWRLN